MKVTVWAAIWLGAAACDQDYDAEADAADAVDGEVGETGVSLYRGYGGYGADPASGMSVGGEPSYTSPDPAQQPGLVVLGGGPAGLRAAAGRVIAALEPWEGGPLVASAGSDAEAIAASLSGPEPVVNHEAERGSWLVVGGRPLIAEGPEVEAAWAARAPREERRVASEGNAFVARLPLALERLPLEVRRVIGAEVRVFDAAREVCIARIAGLELEARLVHEALGPWDPAYSEKEALARGLRAVVATLEPLAGGPEACAGGMVAVGVRAASPRLYAETTVTPSMRRKAVLAMCALPAWRWRHGDGEALPASHYAAECRELAQTAAVRLFETRGGQRFVLVSQGDMHGGFHVSAAGLENAWAHATGATAEGLLDVQGDGVPELLLRSSYRAPRSIAGVAFAGDLSEPTFTADWEPIPPRRQAVGGYAVPDYSVFLPR